MNYSGLRYRINQYYLMAVLLLFGCKKIPETDSLQLSNDYRTENVIIIVIDGPRFSETWGDPLKKYIPKLANEMAPRGCFNRSFANFGLTKTIPGHTAVSTGVYEELDNNGHQYPSYPSLMQHWLKHTGNSPEKAWVITSKEKLQVLTNTANLEWRGRFLPSFDAVDRLDHETFQRIIEVLDKHQPNLMLINFREPDYYGHQDAWPQYLDAIVKTDSLSWEIFKYLRSEPHYSGNTTFIITNDHGRHLDEIGSGFKLHGDQCSGCTHISFFASGPDFKRGVVIDEPREQIDIAPTVAHLLGLKLEQTDGDIMYELFE